MFEDAASLAEVRDAAWRCAYSGLLSEDAIERQLSGSAERFASLLQRSPDFLCLQVAEFAGHPAAFSVVRPQGRSDDLAGSELTSLYVHPNFQRRGLGSALLLEAERLTGQQDPLYLWVLERNYSALEFYFALGFSPDSGVCELHPSGLRMLRLIKMP